MIALLSLLLLLLFSIDMLASDCLKRLSRLCGGRQTNFYNIPQQPIAPPAKPLDAPDSPKLQSPASSTPENLCNQAMCRDVSHAHFDWKTWTQTHKPSKNK